MSVMHHFVCRVRDSGAVARRLGAASLVLLAVLSTGVAEARRAKSKVAHRAAAASDPIMSRAEILASNGDRLARVGRHVMIGYHGFSQVKALVEHQAITGVFITDHNARGRSASALKSEIDALQAVRRAQDLPPLIIAADQEGGSVSRLSPPLRRQPTLAAILKSLPDDDARRKAVESYAETQAAQLKSVGVTLNFAPVVDLKLNPGNRGDGETRLRLRAVSADPFLVAKVAGWYCAVLAKSGIMCTLKHFPGLGRVTRDTHVTTGEINVSEGTLELQDWVPFRRVMDKPYVATMLGHVRITAIDKTTPASYSKAVIGDMIRSRWNHNGLVITDDFSMGAITRSADRVGGAAVKSLQAGADIILVSYSEKHLDTVMTALIEADKRGAFDAKDSEKSVARIDKAVIGTALETN